MRPELKEDPTFLRYYEILRQNPASIVFAPLAEMLIFYKCYEEAILLCKKGLEKNPESVSGRLALAKAYRGVQNFKRAGEEAKAILSQYPDHPEAGEIVNHCAPSPPPQRTPPLWRTATATEVVFGAGEKVPPETDLSPSSLDPAEDARWNTVTMAEILASQGNITKARQIYDNILKREPNNPIVKEGLRKLP